MAKAGDGSCGWVIGGVGHPQCIAAQPQSSSTNPDENLQHWDAEAQTHLSFFKWFELHRMLSHYEYAISWKTSSQ